jgi:hypothetical protein
MKSVVRLHAVALGQGRPRETVDGSAEIRGTTVGRFSTNCLNSTTLIVCSTTALHRDLFRLDSTHIVVLHRGK